MKRLLIPLFTAMLLLMVGTIALAEGEPINEPQPTVEVTTPAPAEPAPVGNPAYMTDPINNENISTPAQDMVILTQVAGVPTTMTISFTLDGQDVAVVQGSQIILKEAFLASRKSFLKIRLEGEGQLIGAKFDFQPFTEPILLPVVNPILQEKAIVEEQPPEKPAENPVIEDQAPVEEINTAQPTVGDLVASLNTESEEIIEGGPVGNQVKPATTEPVVTSEPTEAIETPTELIETPVVTIPAVPVPTPEPIVTGTSNQPPESPVESTVASEATTTTGATITDGCDSSGDTTTDVGTEPSIAGE